MTHRRLLDDSLAGQKKTLLSESQVTHWRLLGDSMAGQKKKQILSDSQDLCEMDSCFLHNPQVQVPQPLEAPEG